MFITIHVHSCFHFITYICEQYISAHKSDSSRQGEVRACPCWWLERLPLQGGYCVFFFVVHAKVSIHIASQWRVPTKKLGTERSAQMKRRNEQRILLHNHRKKIKPKQHHLNQIQRRTELTVQVKSPLMTCISNLWYTTDNQTIIVRMKQI